VGGGGQDNCTSVAAPNVPPLGSYAVAEVLVAMFGIIIFGFFGVKIEVLNFWKQIFGGNVMRIVDSMPSFEISSRSQQSSEKERKRD